MIYIKYTLKHIKTKFIPPERQSYGREIKSFFDAEPDYKSSRALTNHIICPEEYKCTKLHKESESVCCPIKKEPENTKISEPRQQTSKFFKFYKEM